jgi:hypothetical protein
MLITLFNYILKPKKDVPDLFEHDFTSLLPLYYL